MSINYAQKPSSEPVMVAGAESLVCAFTCRSCLLCPPPSVPLSVFLHWGLAAQAVHPRVRKNACRLHSRGCSNYPLSSGQNPAVGPLPPSPTRRTHRPIPIQSFRQSFEAKSAHAHQAFFQEFEVRPLLPSGSEQRGPGPSRLGWACPEVWGELPAVHIPPLSLPWCGERWVHFRKQRLARSLQELKEVGKEQPRLEAEHPANATKNRYPHVLPCECRGADGQGWAWTGVGGGGGCSLSPGTAHTVFPSADDHSRVRLTQLEGEPHSDYINANFIPVRATFRAGCGCVRSGDWLLCRTRCPTLAVAVVHEDHQLVFL